MPGRSLACLLLLAPFAVDALEIRIHDPDRHDRFSSGYPTSPVPNPQFFQADKDLSGLGWNPFNPGQSFALITPQHFVGANHFRTSIGNSIRFLSRDEQVHDYTLSQVFTIQNDQGQGTDLFIGELAQPIPVSDNVSFFRVPELTDEAFLIGRSIVVYGNSARAGRGVIDSFIDFGGDPLTGTSGVNDTRAYDFTYNLIAGFGDDANFEGGDSGSPSFVEEAGELALVGVHMAAADLGLTQQNFDTSVTFYIDKINAAIAHTGFEIQRVPEPGTAACLVGAAACILARSRRRRCLL